MKLSREPCARCATDTLHKASVCTVCGEVAHRHLDTVVERRKRNRAYYAKLSAGFGENFCPMIASSARSRSIGITQSIKAQNAEDKINRLPRADTPQALGVFGRGRERTKV